MATPGSDPVEKLKRERAGTYRTGDGRFTVEQTSSGWLLMDEEQTDELGLPLARGPFATLDDARAAITAARTGPAPISELGDRQARPSSRGGAVAKTASPRPARKAPPPRDRRPAVVIREIRVVDGDGLRALWRDAEFGELGDDDLSLARLARRNPGLVLVAAKGSKIVGSALGAWDGRRGWIYHVVTATTHRRQGIATRLIDQIEAGLASLGCPKANVIVRPDSDGGAEFWLARGYGRSESRQFGKELNAR